MNLTVGALWGYFTEHRQSLAKEYQLIASDEKLGSEIYLTEENGFPCFSVDMDGEEVYKVETSSCLDAERTYDTILATYIDCDDGNDDDEVEEGSDDDRIQEIRCAVEDLLFVLLEEDPYEAGMTPREVDDIASIVEQHLCDECGISVRHPTEVDGEIVQYPFNVVGYGEEGGDDEDEDDLEVEP